VPQRVLHQPDERHPDGTEHPAVQYPPPGPPVQAGQPQQPVVEHREQEDRPQFKERRSPVGGGQSRHPRRHHQQQNGDIEGEKDNLPPCHSPFAIRNSQFAIRNSHRAQYH